MRRRGVVVVALVVVAVLAALIVARGSEQVTSSPPPAKPSARAQALNASVVAQPAKPIAAGSHYKIRAARARGLGGLDLWNAVVDPMIDPLGPLDGAAKQRRILNRPQYAVYALFAIDTDLEDGGLWEVYFNSSGVFADRAVQLLRYVGAPRHAAVLARANHILWHTGIVPASELVRRGVDPLSAESRFNAVNDAWSRAENQEGSIDAIIARFIRAHPRAFFY